MAIPQDDTNPMLLSEQMAADIFGAQYSPNITKTTFFSTVCRSLHLHSPLMKWAREKRPELLAVDSSIRLETSAAAFWRVNFNDADSVPTSFVLTILKQAGIVFAPGSCVTENSDHFPKFRSNTHKPAAHVTGAPEEGGNNITCRVRASFEPQGSSEMQVLRGDIVKVLRSEYQHGFAEDDGWISAEIVHIRDPTSIRNSERGDRGFVPKSFLALIGAAQGAVLASATTRTAPCEGHSENPAPIAMKVVRASDAIECNNHTNVGTHTTGLNADPLADLKPASCNVTASALLQQSANTSLTLAPPLGSSTVAESKFTQTKEYLQGYIDALCRVRMEAELRGAETATRAAELMRIHCNSNAQMVMPVDLLMGHARNCSSMAQRELLVALEERQRRVLALMSGNALPQGNPAALEIAAPSQPLVNTHRATPAADNPKLPAMLGVRIVRGVGGHTPAPQSASIKVAAPPSTSFLRGRATIEQIREAARADASTSARSTQVVARSSSVSSILRSRFALADPASTSYKAPSIELQRSPNTSFTPYSRPSNSRQRSASVEPAAR